MKDMRRPPAEDMRRALRAALIRRSRGPIGSRLQDLYASDYAVATRARADTFFGSRLDVMLPELVSCELHAYGVIEPGLTALFMDAVDEGCFVYDVGAHFGYYSLLAAALGATVYAFEPSTGTAEILRGNVGDAVTVVNKGLWSEEAAMELKDFGEHHSAINTFVSSKDANVKAPATSYMVRVTTLDLHAQETRHPPNLIKIDAEGAELHVLKGAQATIRTASPLITIEVGDSSGERTSREVVDYATELGYAPYDLTDRGPRRHEKRDVYEYGNLLLIPPGADPPNLRALR